MKRSRKEIAQKQVDGVLLFVILKGVLIVTHQRDEHLLGLVRRVLAVQQRRHRGGLSAILFDLMMHLRASILQREGVPHALILVEQNGEDLRVGVQRGSRDDAESTELIGQRAFSDAELRHVGPIEAVNAVGAHDTSLEDSKACIISLLQLCKRRTPKKERFRVTFRGRVGRGMRRRIC